MVYAAAAYFTEALELLIEKGADIDAAGESGMTALMVAATLGHRPTVETLLAAGASVDERADTDPKFSLPGVLEDRAADCRRFLPSIPVEGATALWLAAQAGHREVVKLLLDSQADVDYEATCGHLMKDADDSATCTAREAAEFAGHRETASLFDRPAAAEKVFSTP